MSKAEIIEEFIKLSWEDQEEVRQQLNQIYLTQTTQGGPTAEERVMLDEMDRQEAENPGPYVPWDELEKKIRARWT